MKPKPIIISVLAFVFTSMTNAQQFMPSSNLVLMTLPPGAREMGLAGASTAGAGNAFSIYYNPAGLTSIKTFSAGADGIDFPWPNGLFYGNVSSPFYSFYSAYNISGLFTAGVSFTRSKYSGQYFYGPNVSNREYLAGFAVARDFSELFSAGIGVKFGRNSIDVVSYDYSPERSYSYSATLFSLDLGLLLRQIVSDPLFGTPSNGSGLNLGLVFKDIGPTYEYFSGQGEPLPSNMRIGVSYGWLNDGDFSSTFVLDLVKYLNDQGLLSHDGVRNTYAWFNAIFKGWTDQSPGDELRHISYLTGLEVSYKKMIFFRVGRGRDFTPYISTWSVGIGGRYLGIGADVAFVSKKYIYLDPRAYKDTSDSGLRFTASYER
jgi:hypothetical protein